MKEKTAKGGWVCEMQEIKAGMYKALRAFYEKSEDAESLNAVRACLRYIETMQEIMNEINENLKM